MNETIKRKNEMLKEAAAALLDVTESARLLKNRKSLPDNDRDKFVDILAEHLTKVGAKWVEASIESDKEAVE